MLNAESMQPPADWGAAPVWLTVSILAIGAALTLVDKFSHLGGTLGKVLGLPFRLWNSRQERRVDRVDRVNESIERAVKTRVDMELGPLKEQVASLRDELTATRKELAEEREARRTERAEDQREFDRKADELQYRLNLRDEWITLAHEWAYAVMAKAPAHNFPLPSGWVSFMDWIRQRSPTE